MTDELQAVQTRNAQQKYTFQFIDLNANSFENNSKTHKLRSNFENSDLIENFTKERYPVGEKIRDRFYCCQQIF